MSTTLEARLAAIKTASAAKIPAAAQTIMAAEIEALDASGMPARALGAGEPFPPLTLDDHEGNPVDLAALWQRGPLVLTFFRGHW